MQISESTHRVGSAGSEHNPSNFQQKKDQNANKELSAEDEAQLNQRAHYLDNLVGKVYQSLYKIRRKGLLNDIINRGMWIVRRADLKELEREIYAWTQRFDVRVLGLPTELRAIIPSSSIEVEAPALIKSNNGLKTFLKFAPVAKDKKGEAMRLDDSKDLADRIIDRGVSPKLVPGMAIFKDLDSEMGLLAAALHCLSPAADLRLLKVERYFFHEETNQFIFTQVAPYPIVSAITLELTIKYDSFPEAETLLDHRFKLALKLAESVFFLHTAGFVHKNIATSSIVVLQRPDSPLSLEDFYLMGFELIRGVDGRKDDKKSTPVATYQEARPI
ncbi:hypothetical protein BFJ66_g10815 [Fusarium oxysporum f. sp. cepae]|uniref:Protein kinase domain-containing protein n=1 Tax=Fusarium oxysporum f. sp. cepae TaxID=396571 RepID=A0A3L6NF81_FUSOX|nr:hypothetical protein BFJ65_g10125 [Fusarium oxysporum f. sp. cepae]RKK35567.1 hypothetical protein BFJ67_g13211 [Fusarium oxysporum f. sp. cepae]RKK41730.1 hypothetical protein BFJ66_g10815 [Fusarium oxysporum f. sp. cepae]